MEDGRVVGILTRQDLLSGLTRGGQQTFVKEWMETVEPTEMLETALRRLQSYECYTVPVLRRGELVGLVTMDNIGEFIAIHAALDTREPKMKPI